MIILYQDPLLTIPILTTSLIHFLFERLGEFTFWTWEWKGKTRLLSVQKRSGTFDTYLLPSSNYYGNFPVLLRKFQLALPQRIHLDNLVVEAMVVQERSHLATKRAVLILVQGDGQLLAGLWSLVYNSWGSHSHVVAKDRVVGDVTRSGSESAEDSKPSGWFLPEGRSDIPRTKVPDSCSLRTKSNIGSAETQQPGTTSQNPWRRHVGSRQEPGSESCFGDWAPEQGLGFPLHEVSPSSMAEAREVHAISSRDCNSFATLCYK